VTAQARPPASALVIKQGAQWAIEHVAQHKHAGLRTNTDSADREVQNSMGGIMHLARNTDALQTDKMVWGKHARKWGFAYQPSSSHSDALGWSK
jgi:hypothetical protein